MRMQVETVQGCKEPPHCESRLGGGAGVAEVEQSSAAVLSPSFRDGAGDGVSLKLSVFAIRVSQ